MNTVMEIGGKKYQVEYVENAGIIPKIIRMDEPKWITFDTESDGLHIKKARPFLGIVAWSVPYYAPNPIDGVCYVFPATKENLDILPYIARLTDRIYAHNTTIDMHFAANVIGEEKLLEITNWGDTMGLCRLIFDAVPKDKGGDSLALKAVSTKYIDPKANECEKAVKSWLRTKEAENEKMLTVVLKMVGWTKKKFMEYVDGKMELPEEVYHAYHDWKAEYPKPTYKDVPMDIMLPYAALDGILTDILVHKALPVVNHKQQESVMEMEFELIPVVFDMERVGIEVDREYLQESLVKLDDYISILYTRLVELAGKKFKSGQHAVIKKLYADKLGATPKSTDKQFLRGQLAKGDELAGIIGKLRTLEKWRSTYLVKILTNSEYDGRFYTQLGQFIPVTGRFSGDAQQFPRDPLLTVAGDAIKKDDGDYEQEVIFNPRRSFLGRTYYLDYSQVELRVQAHYTLPFGGDTNLCRAYMPFKCRHSVSGEIYSYDTFDQRRRWIDLRAGHPTNLHWEKQLEQGWSVWVVPETGLPWIPTDVHSSTTLKALIIMGLNPETMSKKEFKWWRSKGKTFNFMRNYGGGTAKAAEVLEIELDQAAAMNNGYTDAFPMVVVYQKKVERAMQKGYAVIHSGRRYYLKDSRKFYTIANYIIQGWAAYMLKQKMIDIWKYLRKEKSTIKMQLCVHDELQFATPVGQDHHIPIIKAMMEDLPQVNVPIIAEIEFTDTNWSEKKKVLEVA